MPDTTIVNTPPAGENSAASLLFVIVLIVLIGGGAFFWYRYVRVSSAQAPAGVTNVNVIVPTPVTSGTPGTTK